MQALATVAFEVMQVHASAPALAGDNGALPQAHPRAELRTKWLTNISCASYARFSPALGLPG